ncbi:DUF58 domain-containing protein [Oharaeibacter diazotrophicus]|uniref:Uncharacterized protein DUF58 n=1 Tax=Oharaeibacter diazotrophicus TaxID=1920512 RepID=A0A4R6RDM0_9HYPH|nr:DUF58 domain-containing protein [Oharaeibacter diazotrophicus]TDP84204.1 uncharacterized protein DUF58 [Oharaeibacter diazotrophicus]BBE73242.1 hypothetical protein OHA_1_02851 [Pleomorphomonas sp. SM30]
MSAVLDVPGIRLSAAELLALREASTGPDRARPATRKPGAVAGRPPGAGMDLREIRAFADGDDARRIDVAATARTGTLHVRSFHEDRDDSLVLLADFRAPMLWGTGAVLRSVAGARGLACAGWRAVARGASVAGLAVGAHGVAATGLRTGVSQMAAIARLFAAEHDAALAAPAADRSLGEALARAARLAPPGAEVVLATGPDGVAADDEAALARLARRRRVTLLLPLDPLDTAPPAAALPIRAGGLVRLARLAPFDRAALAARLGRANVALETIAP